MPAMTIVTVHDAKTRLSRLIANALAGEDIVIARRDEPVVRLVPVHPPTERCFGALKGKISIGPEFFEALPEDELAQWDGN
jgi:prevent-host-death family protein